MWHQILMLDTEAPNPSWRAIPIKGKTFSMMVGQVGCIPFSSCGYDNTEYLIFGAVKAFVLR
jgi:hypothetical protein